MLKMPFILAGALATLIQMPACATEIVFSGRASGVDPLGHAYTFDGRTFTLSSGAVAFNPLQTALGGGTTARSFRFHLDAPGTFLPDPVAVPNLCPAGQTAVSVGTNPVVVTCVGMASGPRTRYEWAYRSAGGGSVSFDAPPDGELMAAQSTFSFVLQFQQPIGVNAFAFTAAWSNVSAVPEPSTAGSLLLGLVSLAAFAASGRRRVVRHELAANAPSGDTAAL